MKDTHIKRLQQGKSSGIHIGSRSIPHHLHSFETQQLELALRRGYVLLKERQRINLSNIYYLHCERLQIPMIKVAMANGIARVEVDTSTAESINVLPLQTHHFEKMGTYLYERQTTSLQEAKEIAASLVDTLQLATS